MAENDELERRILSRNASRRDASEATLDVLHAQQHSDEPLTEDELQYLLRIDTRQMTGDEVWSAFQEMRG